MNTIEMKFLEINEKEIEEKLKKMKAKKTLDSEINAHYFDYADNRLESNRTILRLRKKGDVCMLTTKREISRDNAKITEKHFTQIIDFEETRNILKTIGFSEVRGIKRHRKRYALGNNTFFDIDVIKEIPPFLEIEAKTEKEIDKYRKELGIKEKGHPWTTRDILKYYKKG